jgi:DNA-binding SARP family transcriptional activator/TolB-like protein
VIRLTLFGQCDLVDSTGTTVSAVLKQRKQLAVLAYLSLAAPGGVCSRDTVTGLFWPDATQRRARHALSQVIHALREALGPAVVVSRGREEVGAAADVIWCDAVAFESASKHGDAASALALYQGELLPGFFISAGPEFEHWLADKREEYRRSATTMAWQLAESAERDGHLQAAVAFAMRAVEISLNDEASVQMLLRLFDRVGDRAGALHAYQTFQRRLAREYEIEPSAETKELIAHLRSRGEELPRFGSSLVTATGIANVESVLDVRERSPERAVAVGDSPSILVRRLAHRKVLRLVTLVVGASAALLFASVWGLRGRVFGSNDVVRSGRMSIAVDLLPASDTSPASEALAKALTDAVIDQIAQVRSFDVVALEQQRSLRNQGDPGTPHLLLTGSVLQSHGRVRVTVRISDAASGRAVKSAVLDRASGEQIAAMDVLSRQISSLVRTTTGHEVRLREWAAVRAGGHADERVYELMQQADEDRDMANQLEQSGNFSAAARALRSSDSSLTKVESMAPRWVEPMVERAAVLQRIGALHMIPPLRDTVLVKESLALGVAVATRAVSLDRSNAAALESLGTLSYWYWLTVPVSADSALRLLSRSERMLEASVAADPGRTEAWSLLSAVLYARADYAGAYLAANSAYRADAYLANPQEILSALSVTAYEIGDDSTSRYWCDELNRQFAGSWTGAYCRLNVLTRGDERSASAMVIARAWKIAVDTAWSSVPEQRIEPHFHMLVAAVLARYGLRDSARAVLRRAATDMSRSHDLEIVPLEAYARVLLGQYDTATKTLTRYVADRPLARAGIVRSRRFVGLPGLQRQLTLLKVPQAIR